MKKEFESFFAGKKVTVMGLGLLGRGINDVKFLSKYCDEVLVTDLKTNEELQSSLEEIKDLKNIKLVLGQHRLEDFENRDFVLKAAGVPLDSIFIAHAKKNNVPVYMDEALFALLAPKIATIGVTGTRGKTTTTMMIEKIIKDSGKKIILGGNIKGLATLPFLESVQDGDIVLMELSSWQLQGFGDIGVSPYISVFTNFYDDHLNYYKNDKDLYFKDKSLIYKNQKPEDFIIFGSDIPENFKSDILKSISQKSEVGVENFPNDINLRIPGEHNKSNAVLAMKVGKILNISEDSIKKSLENFTAAPGRLELVRQFNGISIYNDTTATTEVATISAINALYLPEKNLILIMGGADKKLEMTEIFSVIKEKVSKVILLPGTGTDLIKDKIKDGVLVSSMKEAVEEAFKYAESGSTVLLSPAFASFGLFKNEFDRGDQFDEIIKNL
jgi:UDP-N-acetylmuramoylalanine--D-glutamate ligase